MRIRKRNNKLAQLIYKHTLIVVLIWWDW